MQECYKVEILDEMLAVISLLCAFTLGDLRATRLKLKKIGWSKHKQDSSESAGY
jgi:hypothetical protein